VYATVHWQVCDSTVLIVTMCNCKEATIKPTIQSRTHYFRQAYHPTCDNIKCSIYQLKYLEYKKAHVNQMGCNFRLCYKQHVNSIINNKCISGYTSHKICHSYSSFKGIVNILQITKRGSSFEHRKKLYL
jgi:hypothetical protein